MRSLSASDLLAAWERGAGRPPTEQALYLLAVCTGEPCEDLASLSIGQRDAKLFEIYERLFGPELAAFVECSKCGERLEYRLSARDLMQPVNSPEDSDGLSLILGEFSLCLRLPTSRDLIAAQDCINVMQARRLLAERCVVEARRDDREITAQEITEATIDKISSRLAAADPQAETLVDLKCLACNHVEQIVFAIEQFLWAKIACLAKRLLREVDILARTYGWSEQEILSLSAVRREQYLELVTS
jgi:hypothetical protein